MKTKPRIQIDLRKVEEYAQVCDNEEEIANALGISYSTLQSRKRENEDFRSAIKRGKAKANVFVGGKLMEKIKSGDTASIIFYMKSRCGWREVNRTELSGPNGGPIQSAVAPDLSGVDLKKLKAARELLYGGGKASDTN
nr:MAG TPA: terminase small subunit [Caudoviricetes sp.]